jgi:hypothetical protein
MKLRRYRLSGRTHSKGMAATFWAMWLETASSSTEAQAGRRSQKAYSRAPGCPFPAAASGAGPGGATSAARPARMAVAMHNRRNAPYAADQIAACSRVVETGSKRNG